MENLNKDKGKRLRMDDNKKKSFQLEIITSSSHEEQSDISMTMDNINKSAKEKLFPRFNPKALKSMIEQRLFSDSASRDWAGSVVKLSEGQKEKT